MYGSLQQSFWAKLGRRTASTGCWWSSEQSTGVWASADAVRILMKTSTQLSHCCWVRKSHRTVLRIFTWSGGSVDHQFCKLFKKICISSAARKGVLNSGLKRTACTRYFRYAVRDDNVITSKPTWKLKHANSSRVIWIFLSNVNKIDLQNFELYRFKVGPFFETV